MVNIRTQVVDWIKKAHTDDLISKRDEYAAKIGSVRDADTLANVLALINHELKEREETE